MRAPDNGRQVQRYSPLCDGDGASFADSWSASVHEAPVGVLAYYMC